MSEHRPPEQSPIVPPLLRAANQRLVRAVDALTDEQWREPSALPDWTRAHVVAHLALNGEGITAALHGLTETRSVPMYVSQEARDADIEKLAAADPSELRGRLMATTVSLTSALAAVPANLWQRPIERIAGQDRVFTPTQVPGMRMVEVEVHHVDLAVGYGRDQWDPEFGGLLVDAALRRPGHAEGFTVRATDLDRSWIFGPDRSGPAVTGTAADLGWWLTGRGDGEGVRSDDGRLPRRGQW